MIKDIKSFFVSTVLDNGDLEVVDVIHSTTALNAMKLVYHFYSEIQEHTVNTIHVEKGVI